MNQNSLTKILIFCLFVNIANISAGNGSQDLLVPQDNFSGQTSDQTTEQETKKITVRVLLKEEICPEQISWKIGIENTGGFTISAPGTKSRDIDSQELNITVVSGKFYINGKKILKDNIIIKPKNLEQNIPGQNIASPNLILDGVVYNGNFVLIKSENKFYLINFVDLESYVSSVLYGESWPGWPVDINEVFAIMCRTYVVSKIIDARKSKTKKQFDVKATNHHQTYRGYHTFSNFTEAVENTKSVVLTYEGSPINAMYDCCCGGIITADSVGQVNFKHAPYLSRAYACTHCKDTKIFNWSAQYSTHDLLKILGPEYKNLKNIKDIQITKRDKAGIVREIKITGSNSTQIVLTGKKIYKLLKNVKSLFFEVVKRGNRITFNGQGYGHLMGLCQWGARQMVKDGWGYKQVLRFYYPGTSFMKIKLK